MSVVGVLQIQAEPVHVSAIDRFRSAPEREFLVDPAAEPCDLDKLGADAASFRILSQLLKSPSIEQDYGSVKNQMAGDRPRENPGFLFKNKVGAAARLYVCIQRFKHVSTTLIRENKFRLRAVASILAILNLRGEVRE